MRESGLGFGARTYYLKSAYLDDIVLGRELTVRQFSRGQVELSEAANTNCLSQHPLLQAGDRDIKLSGINFECYFLEIIYPISTH